MSVQVMKCLFLQRSIHNVTLPLNWTDTWSIGLNRYFSVITREGKMQSCVGQFSIFIASLSSKWPAWPALTARQPSSKVRSKMKVNSDSWPHFALSSDHYLNWGGQAFDHRQTTQLAVKILVSGWLQNGYCVRVGRNYLYDHGEPVRSKSVYPGF